MSLSRLRILALSLATVLLASGVGLAQDTKVEHKGSALTWAKGAPIPEDQFEALLNLICPQPGESKWALLPWMTNLSEARKKSVETDMPILFWRAGGGDPLGRV